MRKFLDSLYLASGWLAAFFLAAIGLLVVVQVFLNLIDRVSTVVTGTAIGLTIPSYADFTGFFLAAASFLALAHTFRAGGHIRVSLLISNLPAKAARAVEFWCLGISAAITGYFTWYSGVLLWQSYSFHDLSPGMIAVPLWIPQSGMLIGLAVLFVALLDELIGLLSGRRPCYLEHGDKILSRKDRHDAAVSAGEETRA
jgi:TRAP-type C4-dicarboxylate transport system permease small subunit